MKKLLALLAAGLMLGSFNAAGAAANYSDTWWNPQEIGTGLQMVQQGETAFVKRMNTITGYTFTEFQPSSPFDTVRYQCREASGVIAQR